MTHVQKILDQLKSNLDGYETCNFLPNKSGNYSREEIIQGLNIYEEIRYIFPNEIINFGSLCKGLPVVTVLIGVFSKSTGTPLAGVVNQPFAFYDKQTKG